MKAKIIEKAQLTPTVIFLRLKPETPFLFEAGQHIVLKMRSAGNQANQAIERQFSIASAPNNSGLLELLVKIVPGGLASIFFAESKPGADVEISGPKGDFRMAGNPKSLQFIAAGTGLAPIRSMLFYAIREIKTKIPMHLLFVVLSPAEFFLRNELLSLDKIHPGFKFDVLYIKNPEAEKGRLELALKKSAENKDCDFYICGSNAFTELCVKILKESGVPGLLIHFESF